MAHIWVGLYKIKEFRQEIQYYIKEMTGEGDFKRFIDMLIP